MFETSIYLSSASMIEKYWKPIEKRNYDELWNYDVSIDSEPK